MSKIKGKRTGSKWLGGLTLPKRRKYKTEKGYLRAVYRLNQDILNPQLNAQRKTKQQQFVEVVLTNKKNKHLMWQLDKDRITTKQALEAFVRTHVLKQEDVAAINVRQMLKTTGKEKELSDIIGEKRIKVENIKWNEDLKVFEYFVVSKDKKTGETLREKKATITMNSYNKNGYESVRIADI